MNATRRTPAQDWPRDAVGLAIDLALLPVLVLAALAARFAPKAYDVGLGPEPINSLPTHREALRRRGYRACTYVHHLYYVTSEFDVVLAWPGPLRYLANHALFVWAIFRCRCLFLAFSGGALGNTRLLWRAEPVFYRLAGVRTVMLPYGGDVQDMTRCPNLAFKHAMGQDYPGRRLLRRGIAARVDLWTRWSDVIVGGCDWVDYLYHWDRLMLLHFPVDTDRFAPAPAPPGDEALRVLHAPNHRNLKGTAFLERAVERLRAEGLAIELQVLQGVPNHEVRTAMAKADVVVDQLVIGWYAMFALEAMAMGKPVVCRVREDLEALYRSQGLLEAGELPLIHADGESIEETLRQLAKDPQRLAEAGKRSREFALRRHSVDAVGVETAAILAELGIEPGSAAA